jgi:hypothetical protein
MSSDSEYSELKEFLLFCDERYRGVETLPPEHRLAACLETLEKMGKKTARSGLRQAVNDFVEMSFRFESTEVKRLDSDLRSRGIVTLSEIRRRYSKGYAKIVNRGTIKNETEYYLIRNVLDDPTEKTAEEQELLLKIILDYESRLGSRRAATRSHQ